MHAIKAIVLVAFSALVAAGFASLAAKRFRLVAGSSRSGNRLELIRSGGIGLVMSILAAAAAYGALMRIPSVAMGFGG